MQLQKLLYEYRQVVLWSMIVLLIATPIYIAYDLLFRQPQKVEAQRADYVMKGSYEFASNQCWRCHGVNGEGGIGLPLNKTADIVGRDDKDPFIIKTITHGRYGTQMPVWGKVDGGPLDPEQITALREFIRDGTHWGTYFDEAPVNKDGSVDVYGKVWKPTMNYLADHNLVPPCADTDIACKGKQVFSGPCATCHNITTVFKVGPGLAGIWQKAALPNGKPVNEADVTEWIMKGSASYKPVGSPAPFMPSYAAQVTPEQITQVIEYLKTLK
jgi:mono/diheme cytochrome c family protein